MLSLPPTLLRLPRVWLEHPLPLAGPGLSTQVSYLFAHEESRLITFGGVDRWQRTPTVACPGLTQESFTLICALLSLTERRQGVTLTYNQIFRAMTGSRSLCSGHHREKLKSTLAILTQLDCQVGQDILPGQITPAPCVYQPLISLSPGFSRPVFGRPTPAFVLHFAPAFLELFDDSRAVATFDFAAFLQPRSRLARALYPVLTTWAHYNRAHAGRPFRIRFARLIEHLGAAVPRFRSQRRTFFFGHRQASLFDELQGLSTPHGPLQLKIEDASSVDDDCLCIWLGEPQKGAPSTPASTSIPAAFHREPSSLAVANSIDTTVPASTSIAAFQHLKIYQAWKASGRSDDAFLQRVRAGAITLTQEDLELLHSSKITPSRCESFLLLSKKLLPLRTWLDLLGEAKYAALSHTPPKNPTGKLISEIITHVRAGV